MKSHLWKRTLCCLLTMALILGNIPVFSFAEESDGLCEHHPVHTPECGYSPAIPGSPCTHVHTQDCYQTVAECVHVHDEACGYSEEAGDASCAHVCSEEYGCFKLVPDCHHVHDESCGYVEAAAEQPCAYVCQDCAEAPEYPSEPEEDPSEPSEPEEDPSEPSEPEVDEAVEAVRALIEALPTVEEVKAMSMAEQSEVYNQVQKAYTAYDALTSDQKAQLPEAEGIFVPLFEYFNSLAAPAEATASGTCGTYLTWVLEDGTLTISGSGNMYDFSMSGATGWSQYSSQITKIVVESGVTTIGAYAFGSLKNLENVEIASTVQSIGKYAFRNCSNLHSVNIPNGITEIQECTFSNCSSLAYVSIPNTVTVIRASAFFSCSSLSKVDIPDSVTTIEQDSFSYSGLMSVTLPGNLSTITLRSFNSCEKLQSVIIPSSVKTIENKAFNYSTNMTDVYYEGSEADWNDISIGTDNAVLLDATIHFNWKCVDGHQFSDGVCTVCGIKGGYCGLQGENLIWILDDEGNLTISGEGEMEDYYGINAPWGHGIVSIVIESGATSIGYRAFEDCSMLASAILPNGITEIRAWAFEGCEALTQITIPESVTTVGMWAFGLSGLTSVTIPLNVTKIEDYTFGGCQSLASVTIPEGVTSIGREAFSNCPKLAELTLPSNLTSIGTSAFESCLSLQTVTIPENVASIGGNAFGNAFPDKIPQLTTIRFRGHGFLYTSNDPLVASSVTAYYPAGDNTWTQEVRDSFVGPITWVAAECPVNGTHTAVTDAGYSASCTQDGLTDGSHCSACGAVLVEQTVIPAAHTIFKVEGKDATCTENGVIAHYRCKVCGRRFADESAKTELSNTVLPAGHQFDEKHQCKLCGKIGGEWGDQGTWELVDGCLTIQGAAMFDQLCPALDDAPWGIYSEDICEIVIGNNVGICENAFANLANLEAVTIAAIDGIRDNAFADCGKLNTITFTEEVPFAISQTAFTGVTATAHYEVEYNTWLYSNLQNYGGNLTWVEHGENAKRIAISHYGSSGGIGSFCVQTFPDTSTADCEFTLSKEGIIELTSTFFRGATYKELSPGEVTVTARDKRTGLTASITILVPDTKPKDIECPYEEEILIDGYIVRREYRFTPKTTGYYVSYNSYMGEAGGITVTQGDSQVERFSSQYVSGGEYGVYYLTSGVTYSICLECDSGLYGTNITFRWNAADTQITSIFFEEETLQFDLTPGTEGQFAWVRVRVTPGECSDPITWSIGDSDVAEIQGSDGYDCYLTLKNVGTTTLTASCGGRNASVPLVVHAPAELKLNQTAQVTAYENTSDRLIQFTADETAQYVFTVQGASSVYIDGQRQDPNGYGADGETYFAKVSAGQTLVLRLTLHEDTTASVSAAKAESAPQSMELICLSNTQHEVSFGVRFSPAASMEEIVSWEISDPDLLGESSFSGLNSSRKYYIPYAKGEVTVTATTASGLTASCTLTVGRCFDGHTNVPQVIAPTCTTGGFTINTCSVCGEKTIASRVDALGHDLTHHDAQAATCTEIGWEAYDTCSRCDYTTYEEIPATGHTLSHVNSTPATCTEEGVEEHFHCDLCGKNFEDAEGTKEMSDISIPTKAHTLTMVNGTEATCTETGVKAHYHCTVCGKNFEDANGTKELSDVIISAKGHTLAKVDGKEATCTETGIKAHYHCSVCGKDFEDENGTTEMTDTSIPAKGHSLAKVDGKEATCTETGVKAHYHCSVCGKDFEDANGTKELTDTSIPAKGHSPTKVDGSEPTCTEEGVKAHYHCTACLKNFEDENGTKELSDITIPFTEHEWGEWEVTTPATPEADGEETRKCVNCQKEETRPLTYTGNRVELTGTGLESEQVVWIDGVAIPVQKDGSGKPYVTLPENSSSILVTYSFNTGSGDRHTQYPTGMKVYRVEKTDSDLTVAHLPELDNLLQYSGCSIRIVGVKGIRMITSINKSTRSSLMGDGLAGYKLVEYGTALCRASALEGGAPMVLGTPGVKSNYAYKKDVADPIFKDTGSLIQYTNVLVGFTDEDCKEDIAMRPYITLEDENGDTVTLYGGIVYRSIGYIAYQNRNAFAPGSNAYNYVWNIIHYVYEDQYDADYKG